MRELSLKRTLKALELLGNAITIDGFRPCGFDRPYEWVTNRRVGHAFFP
jgi:hypothetical protein